MAQVIPAIEVDESGQRGDLNVFEDFLKSSSAIILRASLSEKAMELPTKSPVSRGDPEVRLFDHIAGRSHNTCSCLAIPPSKPDQEHFL
ncbi:hypothetical protein MJO28_007339 [Puccinia striiformis f. sp. tritici]|uniref:Uncharacterized protein n=1 Tax=Puccinia striiformis f. sp. tritici TaxID=168172 RepID=A0ACC0EF55_9BASI|nr:hypothetical protein MJO28_007339 [Puccinia striiformis f. sp. tritici]KAI7955881.1 hypothetical protein MJO29_007280 [Puccinia striiformis f. sp. tritici]